MGDEPGRVGGGKARRGWSEDEYLHELLKGCMELYTGTGMKCKAHVLNRLFIAYVTLFVLYTIVHLRWEHSVSLLHKWLNFIRGQ